MDPAVVLISVIISVLVSVLVISGIIVLFRTYVIEAKHNDTEGLTSNISLPTIPEEMANLNSSCLTLVDEVDTHRLHGLTGMANNAMASRGTEIENSPEATLVGEQSSDGKGNIIINTMLEEEKKINMSSSTIAEEDEVQEPCRLEDMESSRRSSRNHIPGNSFEVQLNVEPSSEAKGVSNSNGMECSEIAEEGNTDSPEGQRGPHFGSAIKTVQMNRSDSLVKIDVDKTSIDEVMGALLKDDPRAEKGEALKEGNGEEEQKGTSYMVNEEDV